MLIASTHDVLLAGHMGITRTKDCILQIYYWPGIFIEIGNYCRSCEACQKSNLNYPLKLRWFLCHGFSTHSSIAIGMDVVGPLCCIQRGNCFILTTRDYTKCYPEAVAMPSVEAIRIAKELVNLFSHVGVPD